MGLFSRIKQILDTDVRDLFKSKRWWTRRFYGRSTHCW